jgi:hypothetical protein
MRHTHWHEATIEVLDRGVNGYWDDRIRSMIRHAMCETGHPNGDHTLSAVVGMRVCKDWPYRGSITLTLENGKKKRLFHKKKTKSKPGEFKIEEVK